MRLSPVYFFLQVQRSLWSSCNQRRGCWSICRTECSCWWHSSNGQVTAKHSWFFFLFFLNFTYICVEARRMFFRHFLVNSNLSMFIPVDDQNHPKKIMLLFLKMLKTSLPASSTTYKDSIMFRVTLGDLWRLMVLEWLF